jgi:8-oxo-dGTP pyrophosphatase MutT (NUDIX family)
VIFVERAQHLRRHPGQIGFPGGIEDPVDAGDPVRTALRELGEEIGVSEEQVRIVGRLTELEQHLNQLLITPIVGVLRAGTRFLVDGEEIAGVFAIPLASIVAARAIYEDAHVSATRGRTMYAFDYEGRHIWGFTGRILKSFADAWAAPDSALRAAIEGSACDLKTQRSMLPQTHDESDHRND